MLSALFLLLASVAQADCDADVHSKVAHERPPMDRLLRVAYDGDDSGVVDTTELAARDRDMTQRCTTLDVLFTGVDADGDGVISESEREALNELVGAVPAPGHRGVRATLQVRLRNAQRDHDYDGGPPPGEGPPA